MALAGMLAEVTQTKVAGLLAERQPEILDDSIPAQVTLFEARVTGAAVEVVILVGSDPAPGPLRGLAVEAVALQTASEIEYAEYPEQQTAGDTGRGYHLHQRYRELLDQIQGYVLGGMPGDGTTTGPLAPRGDFPPPEPFPDPALTRDPMGWCWP